MKEPFISIHAADLLRSRARKIRNDMLSAPDAAQRHFRRVASELERIAADLDKRDLIQRMVSVYLESMHPDGSEMKFDQDEIIKMFDLKCRVGDSILEAMFRKAVEVEKQRADEYEQTFNLQQKRFGDELQNWRAANPGNDLVIPDLGDLLQWMRSEIDWANKIAQDNHQALIDAALSLEGEIKIRDSMVRSIEAVVGKDFYVNGNAAVYASAAMERIKDLVDPNGRKHREECAAVMCEGCKNGDYLAWFVEATWGEPKGRRAFHATRYAGNKAQRFVISWCKASAIRELMGTTQPVLLGVRHECGAAGDPPPDFKCSACDDKTPSVMLGSWGSWTKVSNTEGYRKFMADMEKLCG